MATAATRRENNDVPRTAKIDLTPTGLLMEAAERQWRQPHRAKTKTKQKPFQEEKRHKPKAEFR
jgi:hypothetical protein